MHDLVVLLMLNESPDALIGRSHTERESLQCQHLLVRITLSLRVSCQNTSHLCTKGALNCVVISKFDATLSAFCKVQALNLQANTDILA